MCCKEKLVLVINGVGTCGKDTLCELAAKHFKCMNVSSIDPILPIAKLGGWSGDKDRKSRKLLSSLKALFIEYNDLPLAYLHERTNEFIESGANIMFVHIREPTEIKKYISLLSDIARDRDDVILRSDVILITRNTVSSKLGNESDDNVLNYNYTWKYHNDSSIEDAEILFVNTVADIVQFYGLQTIKQSQLIKAKTK